MNPKETALLYCPRCHHFFALDEEKCPECDKLAQKIPQDHGEKYRLIEQMIEHHWGLLMKCVSNEANIHNPEHPCAQCNKNRELIAVKAWVITRA